MKDNELGEQLARSIDRRVGHAAPRATVDEFIARSQRKAAHQHRMLAVGIIVALVVGGAAGYLLGHSKNQPTPARTIQPLNDGTPRANVSPPLAPSNVGAATVAIDHAFHSAYDGGVPPSEQIDAIQDGAALAGLRQNGIQEAQRLGYTPEQLAGTSISLSQPSFIDPTHAIIHFTLTIPGHGAVLMDRIGYAVFTAGQWRVALRTACDLLSLNGLGSQCPPTR